MLQLPVAAYVKGGQQDVMQPTITSNQSSLGGGWDWFNNSLSGIKDTFGTLLEGGLMYENYRQQRDQVGAGQSDVVGSVQRPTNPNASPINADQYATTAQGGNAAAGGMNTNTMLIAGALVLGLVMAFK